MRGAGGGGQFTAAEDAEAIRQQSSNGRLYCMVSGYQGLQSLQSEIPATGFSPCMPRARYSMIDARLSSWKVLSCTSDLLSREICMPSCAYLASHMLCPTFSIHKIPHKKLASFLGENETNSEYADTAASYISADDTMQHYTHVQMTQYCNKCNYVVGK